MDQEIGEKAADTLREEVELIDRGLLRILTWINISRENWHPFSLAVL